MTPLEVSIIIPCFQAERTIARALQSAAEQTISHELIIIDGGSEDRTLEIIQETGIRPDVLTSEPDKGVYDAINKGIDKSRGQWIYVLGSDDELFAPNALELLLRKKKAGVVLLLGRIENIHRSHRSIPAFHDSMLNQTIQWRNVVHQQGAIYHRSLFETFRFDTDLKVLGDYAFHLQLADAKINWQFGPVLLARCEAGGLSKQFTKKLYEEEYRIKQDKSFIIRNFVWLKYLYKKTLGLL